MELLIKLTSADVNKLGAFGALEELCRCFKPEEASYVNVHPPKPKKEAPTPEQEQEPEQEQTPETATETEAAQQPPTVASIPATAVQSMAPPTVPVAGPQSFAIPQVAQAAAIFAETSDEARRQVVELIHGYGVAALADIPQDKLGEFATQLRGMGARI